jgi:hypothetical protein
LAGEPQKNAWLAPDYKITKGRQPFIFSSKGRQPSFLRRHNTMSDPNTPQEHDDPEGQHSEFTGDSDSVPGPLVTDSDSYTASSVSTVWSGDEWLPDLENTAPAVDDLAMFMGDLSLASDMSNNVIDAGDGLYVSPSRPAVEVGDFVARGDGLDLSPSSPAVEVGDCAADWQGYLDSLHDPRLLHSWPWFPGHTHASIDALFHQLQEEERKDE